MSQKISIIRFLARAQNGTVDEIKRHCFLTMEETIAHMQDLEAADVVERVTSMDERYTLTTRIQEKESINMGDIYEV